MFPKKAVGLVTGIGSMEGSIGGVLFQQLAGRLNQHYHATPPTAYLVLFCVCAFAYLVPWCIMKPLVPRFRPVVLHE
ncbi:hypothetical protein [Chitinophaga costaii]|nr:hypothetical protein [Chitinophaga costaii]